VSSVAAAVGSERFLQGLSVSLLASLTIRWIFGRILPVSLDRPESGVQKLHTTPVTRLGGLAIVLGTLTYLLNQVGDDVNRIGNPSEKSYLLFLYLLPVFFIGLIEDCTQKVTPLIRLVVTAASVIWVGLDLGIVISQTDVPMLDSLLNSPWVAIGFTAFALTGFTHAINITDGINGLAASLCLIMLIGLLVIAHQNNDVFIADVAIAGIVGITGFWLLNFPRGLIFMGDGGAYFLGLLVAVCATVLMMKPTVSAFQMLAVCGYPVIETVFSMVRRIHHRRPVGQPDRQHLHSLLYRIFSNHFVRPRNLAPWHAHLMTTTTITGIVGMFVITAVIAGGSFQAGLTVFSLEIAAYIFCYRKLASFLGYESAVN
jgi:UDP-N-acetylmuramyl pentapeptide phosphotransferase/UDP-N-acetylglucosamine-1-phosphate transferase